MVPIALASSVPVIPTDLVNIQNWGDLLSFKVCLLQNTVSSGLLSGLVS